MEAHGSPFVTQYVVYVTLLLKYSDIISFMHLTFVLVVTSNLFTFILPYIITWLDKYHSQKALQPPSLLVLVVSFLWPGALRKQSLKLWLQAPWGQQYSSMTGLLNGGLSGVFWTPSFYCLLLHFLLPELGFRVVFVVHVNF